MSWNVSTFGSSASLSEPLFSKCLKNAWFYKICTSNNHFKVQDGQMDSHMRECGQAVQMVPYPHWNSPLVGFSRQRRIPTLIWKGFEVFLPFITCVCEARFLLILQPKQHVPPNRVRKQAGDSSCLFFRQALKRFSKMWDNAAYSHCDFCLGNYCKFSFKNVIYVNINGFLIILSGLMSIFKILPF